MDVDVELLNMYRDKYIKAIQRITELEMQLSQYTDQSWEMERLRQESYERDRRYEWK
jgi:hypothetical protein